MAGKYSDYRQCSDDELIDRLRRGEEPIMDYICDKYKNLVRSKAKSMFILGADSEDLIQEGTFGLLSAIRRFDPACGVSFKTFAEHCVRMRLLSAIKSASRLKHFPLNDGMSLEELSEDSSTNLSAFSQSFRRSPEDQVLARESKEELYTAFTEQLSRLERKVLSLYLDGLSYKDIAQRLGKEPKAVDNAVQRIRRKLARNFNSGDISIS